MTSNIDPTYPPGGNPQTLDVRDNWQIAATEISALQDDVADARADMPYLPLAGQTMTGPLNLAGDPVKPAEAGSKSYADQLRVPIHDLDYRIAFLETGVLVGTDNAAIDVPALQLAADVSKTGLKIIVSGTFRIAFPPDIWWYFCNQIDRGVHAAIRITGPFWMMGAEGGGATFRFDPPTFAYTSLEQFVAFCTDDNLAPGTLSNITFESNLTFDYGDQRGALPTVTQGIFVVGCDNFIHRGCHHLTSPRTLAGPLTVSRDASGYALVLAPAHGFIPRAVMLLHGPGLPPEIIDGAEYYFQPKDAGSFQLSLIDDGPLVSIAAAGVATSIDGHALNGRGVHADNCRNVLDLDNTYAFIRQGWFLNIGLNATFQDSTFHQLGEGLDIDNVLINGVIDRLDMSCFWGEAQGLDMSPIQNVTVSNITCRQMRQAGQCYTKWDSNGKYSELRLWKYPFWVTWHLGSPGTITLPKLCQLVEGLRIGFFEIRPPGSGAMPSGVAEFTPYYVRNPVGSGGDTPTCNLSATKTGPLIALGGAPHGTVRCYFTCEPNEVIPSANFLIENITGTQMIGLAPPVDADTDPLFVGGKDLWMFGIYRNERVGVDRQAWMVGTAIQCQSYRVRNMRFTGGTRVRVNESIDCDIDGVTVDGAACGNDAIDGAAIVLKQSVHDTGSMTNSVLTGKAKNLTATNSAGMGVIVASASDFAVDGVIVDTFNTQGDDNTSYGFRFARPTMKGGIKSIGSVDVRNGLNGATRATQMIRSLTTGGDTGVPAIAVTGPYTVGGLPPGAVKVYSDIGPFISNKQTFSLPPIDTTVTALQRVVIFTNATAEAQLMIAQLTNDSPLAAGGANYSTARIGRVAGVVTYVGAGITVDQAAQAPNTRSFAINSTDVSTIIPPGQSFVVDFSRNGLGSVLLSGLAFVYFAWTYTVAALADADASSTIEPAGS